VLGARARRGGRRPFIGASEMERRFASRVTAWPWYGHDMAPGSGGVRAGGRPMARGGAAGQRVRARHVAPPGVHERHAHEREARRTDRRSQACLGMWYDDVWQRPT
jgi:hypothetical protein